MKIFICTECDPAEPCVFFASDSEGYKPTICPLFGKKCIWRGVL